MSALGRSIDARSIIPVASALLGPVVGLAAAKSCLGHFRYISPSQFRLLYLLILSLSVMVKDLSQVRWTILRIEHIAHDF
jgi:hypothetical protein